MGKGILYFDSLTLSGLLAAGHGAQAVIHNSFLASEGRHRSRQRPTKKQKGEKSIPLFSANKMSPGNKIFLL